MRSWLVARNRPVYRLAVAVGHEWRRKPLKGLDSRTRPAAALGSQRLARPVDEREPREHQNNGRREPRRHLFVENEPAGEDADKRGYEGEGGELRRRVIRSEEHTSELQSPKD